MMLDLEWLSIFFYYIYICKSNCIKKKSIHDVYKKTKNKKQKGANTQKQPYLTKLLTNLQNQASTRSHPQYTILPNPKIDTKKELFKEWFEHSKFSKALLFLFLQIDQKKHNEAIFQAFFLFLPIGKPP